MSCSSTGCTFNTCSGSSISNMILQDEQDGFCTKTVDEDSVIPSN
jgi:hypothetical protein